VTTLPARHTQPPPPSAARLLRTLRWLLPVTLVGIAIFVEWGEHIRIEGESISIAFVLETTLFGLIGPTAIFLTLSWVIRLLDAYARTSDELAESNVDLEAKIDQRTQHLQLATADLADANEELRQLDRLKSEFVALVSHQLRAPLTNIRGATEILTEDTDNLPVSSRRPLQILTLEADHLSALVTRILDVSRLEAGHLSMSLGPVAIEPLLARACTASLGPERGRRWSLMVSAGLPPAWADETLLEEVVRNLLDNAILHAAGTDPVEISADVGDGLIRVTVADRGPGVPPDEQGRIFQSFHQVGDRDTTTVGYGLGLYFAEKLIDAMGGTIRVESPAWPNPEAPGSRFVFTLPIASDAPDLDDDQGAA
jgi:signal transduction histidine kinase